MRPDDAATRADSERLNQLLRELDARTTDDIRERLRETVALILDLHRQMLQRLLALSSQPPHGSAALVDTFADDPLIAPLLLAHELHPHDLHTRLVRTLDRLRSRVAWAGCRASITAIEETTVRVRLDGADRLPANSNIAQIIEASLLDVAPEVTQVVVDGASVAAPSAPLLQIMRQPGIARG